MSSTNKTTNYNLSQFIGSDKPAWLADYNQDMSKIDAGIASAANSATAADGKADANTAALGDISNLETTAKSSAVAAINEVNTKAITAQGSADSVGTTASANAEKLVSLQAYLNISNTVTVPASIVGGSIASNELSATSNSDGSAGFFSGRFVFNNTSKTSTITLQTPFRPDSAVTFKSIGVIQNSSTNIFSYADVSIATDGTGTISYTTSGTGHTIRIIFPSSLQFAKIFGS